MTLQECVGLFMAGRLEEARRACRKLLTVRPDLAEAHLLLAEIQRAAGDEVRARESTARVLKLRPEWSEARAQLAMGDLFGDFGRYQDAEARYRRALELEPALTDARFNLAAALSAAGRSEECMAELKLVLEHDPRAGDARERLTKMLHDAYRFDELEAVCRQGMALHPQNPVYPERLGNGFWWRGEYEAAIPMLRFAAGLSDKGSKAYRETKLLEATSLLALGRYAEGWDAYHWRSIRTLLRGAHPRLIEDPRQIAALDQPKRIRIVSEQGIGDELFFLRFAVPLRARGHRLSVAPAPKLAPLLAPLTELFEPLDTVDYVITAADLPLACGENFAPSLALPVEAARRDAFWAQLQAFGPPPYIGVTWRAGVLPDEPKPEGVYWVKKIDVEAFAAALRPVDARVVILTRRPLADEFRRFTQALGRPALDLSVVNENLPDALAVLSLLDDYIGMSNTNMHLRAAIPGKGARVFMRMPPEWRWGISGDSPWYPGFKVYRLPLGEDWQRVLDELSRDLAKS